MNQIFFASKRAFHGILRVTRRPLRSLGLTAARFDLLYALVCGGSERARMGTLQSALWRRLGVSASVVSRMLASLQKLGWLTRSYPPPRQDRRQRWVTLTAAGLQRIRTALKMLRRASWRLVHEAICFGKHREPSLQSSTPSSWRVISTACGCNMVTQQLFSIRGTPTTSREPHATSLIFGRLRRHLPAPLLR